MDLFRLDRSDPGYPTALNQYLGKDAPLSVAASGNLEILTHNKLALFCSVNPTSRIQPRLKKFRLCKWLDCKG